MTRIRFENHWSVTEGQSVFFVYKSLLISNVHKNVLLKDINLKIYM